LPRTGKLGGKESSDAAFSVFSAVIESIYVLPCPSAILILLVSYIMDGSWGVEHD
jgi:hypothetical protein